MKLNPAERRAFGATGMTRIELKKWRVTVNGRFRGELMAYTLKSARHQAKQVYNVRAMDLLTLTEGPL